MTMKINQIENAEYRLGLAVGEWARSQGFGELFAGGFYDSFHDLDAISSSTEGGQPEPKVRPRISEPKLLSDILPQVMENIRNRKGN